MEADNILLLFLFHVHCNSVCSTWLGRCAVICLTMCRPAEMRVTDLWWSCFEVLAWRVLWDLLLTSQCHDTSFCLWRAASLCKDVIRSWSYELHADPICNVTICIWTWDIIRVFRSLSTARCKPYLACSIFSDYGCSIFSLVHIHFSANSNVLIHWHRNARVLFIVNKFCVQIGM